MIDSQENVLAPRTLWAQNKHQVFLTFEIFEGKDIKVEFEKDKVRFSGVQSDSNQKYEVELELYENIVPDVSIIHVGAVLLTH